MSYYDNLQDPYYWTDPFDSYEIEKLKQDNINYFNISMTEPINLKYLNEYLCIINMTTDNLLSIIKNEKYIPQQCYSCLTTACSQSFEDPWSSLSIIGESFNINTTDDYRLLHLFCKYFKKNLCWQCENGFIE